MSDKIKTEDCVKAICGYWEKAIDEGRNLPIGKYHGEASDLINPKYWKRVKKLGNPNEGFVRLFSNVVVDKECTRAGEEAVSLGRVDLSARIKWVMVVRATDDEFYDVCPGEMIDGEFLEGDELERRLRALSTPLAAVPTVASYEEMFGKGSASEPAPIDDEEAWQKVYGEDYKKFPTDGCGQPEPPADSLIPGGAIHLNVDKEFTCVRRSSKKYIKLMEATCGEGGCKFSKKKIKPGAVFLFLSPDEAKVEDVLTFPKGGVAYIDSDEGPFPDYGAVDNLFLEDDAGNVWLAGDEPQDDTKTVDECWEGKDLKKAKDAIAKYGATVVIRHM